MIYKKMVKNFSFLKYIKFCSDRYLDIHITDHCDLNCYGCAHFAPIANQYYINLDDLESTYKKLQPLYIQKKLFNKIHLLGGEPLLHPEIESIIKLTRNYFPNTQLQIVTNGLKLPSMPESFFQSCVDNSLKIYISKYPISLNYEKICTIFKKYNIDYEFSNDREEFIKHIFNIEGTQNIKNSYKNCIHGGTCLQLRDNKIFPCAQIAYISYINKKFNTNFQYVKDDYIDLDDLKNNFQLMRFILSPKPFCKYCDKKCEHPIKWQHSKQSKEEWFNL